jgi:hypothetical protein
VHKRERYLENNTFVFQQLSPSAAFFYAAMTIGKHNPNEKTINNNIPHMKKRRSQVRQFVCQLFK